MKAGIWLNDVSFGYKSGNLQLKNISLQIQKGGFLGVTGVNGSGKTTLSFLLNGLIPHEIPGKLTGDVFVDGINTKKKPVSFFADKVGMLFQNPDFMLFNLTVFDEVAFGLKKENFEKKVSQALEMVGLKDFEKRDPQTLSLGEKQKVCLASVLARDTEYLVLDEPVAMLDYKGAVNFYRLLKKINEVYKKTIIVIEHDTEFLLAYVKQVVILDHGEIIFEGKPNSVFSHQKEIKKLGIKIPQPIL